MTIKSCEKNEVASEKPDEFTKPYILTTCTSPMQHFSNCSKVQKRHVAVVMQDLWPLPYIMQPASPSITLNECIKYKYLGLHIWLWNVFFVFLAPAILHYVV